MFRELVRKNKELSKDECIKILIQEKRGVLSVIGDNDYPYGMPMNHFYNEEDDAYVEEINALKIGEAAMLLGAGRETKEQDVDPNVGIELHKKIGDKNQ